MVKPAVSFSQHNGRTRCDVHNVPDWDGLEKLARFLEKYYAATILERIDGPDARRWVLRVNDIQVELQHEDPYGNALLAVDAEGDDLVRVIGDDLGARLAGVEPQPDAGSAGG